jgi:hypothetical protein
MFFDYKGDRRCKQPTFLYRIQNFVEYCLGGNNFIVLPGSEAATRHDEGMKKQIALPRAAGFAVCSLAGECSYGWWSRKPVAGF